MFSFRAVYEAKNKSEYINLLNDMYIEYITDIIIDKKRVNICTNYNFFIPGNHTVYVTMNIETLNSLSLFNDNSHLISVYFTKQFNTQKIISLDYNFYNCENVISLIFQILN